MKNILELFPATMPESGFIIEDDKFYGIRVKKRGERFEIVSEFQERLKSSLSLEDFSEENISINVERMLSALGSPQRASLVLPDSIFRMQIVDIENYPKEIEEREKILLWQARRVLGHPNEDLRVSHIILSQEGRYAKVWLAAAPKSIFSIFEKTFETFGCHIGFITSTTISLYDLFLSKNLFHPSDINLLMSITSNSLTFLFTLNGELLFFRTKEFKKNEDYMERIVQEIKLTLLFQKEKLGPKPLRKVYYRITDESIIFPKDEFGEDVEIFSIEEINLFSEKKDEVNFLLPILSAISEAK